MPSEHAQARIESGSVQWAGPRGPALVLHDGVALPTLDLRACWPPADVPPAPAPAALVLRPVAGGQAFALRVDAVGGCGELDFWPLPPAVQAASGVCAAALRGMPWQATIESAVLLLDVQWLQRTLQAEAAP